MSASGHVTFNGIFGNSRFVLSRQLQMVIPAKKTFMTYVLYILPSKFCWTEKKSFLTSRFPNFANLENKPKPEMAHKTGSKLIDF